MTRIITIIVHHVDMLHTYIIMCYKLLAEIQNILMRLGQQRIVNGSLWLVAHQRKFGPNHKDDEHHHAVEIKSLAVWRRLGNALPS